MDSVIDSPKSATDTEDLGEHRSLWADVWRQFRRHRGAMIGLVLFSLISLAVLIGPFVYPYDPYEIDYLVTNQSASLEHPMGTDQLGRDSLSRMLIGGRISLAVGFAAMFVGLFIGTFVGVMAGYFRKLDWPLMRITDLFLSLPQLPLLLVIVMLFRESLKELLGENLGIFLLVVFVIGITASWMVIARVVRGDVLSIKEEEFVLAARSIGVSRRNIVARHILPNVLSSVTVAASLGTATAIITESALSFLGLGFPTSLPTWGRLLSDGKDYLSINPWRSVGPGLLISLTVLSVNFVGDGLRDALDPKLRSKG